MTFFEDEDLIGYRFSLLKNVLTMERNDRNVGWVSELSSRCKSCLPPVNEGSTNSKGIPTCMKILSIFGHKALDEKLLRHNIIRRRSNTARFVRNLMSKSLATVQTPGFRTEDLEKLSLEELCQLRESFTKKLADKTRERDQEVEIKLNEMKRRVQFMSDIRNIEHAAKNILKPCVNVLPDSDDMARVLLLN